MNRLVRPLVACYLCAALLSTLACEGAETQTAAAQPAPPAPRATEAASPAGDRPAEPSPDDAEVRRQPSFRQFSAWLEAYNSGDRERYAQFLRDEFPIRLRGVIGGPEGALDGDMQFREFTGGFDLRKLQEVSADHITGLMQERNSDLFFEFELGVAPTEPHRILYLLFEPTERPAEFAIERLTEDE